MRDIILGSIAMVISVPSLGQANSVQTEENHLRAAPKSIHPKAIERDRQVELIRPTWRPLPHPPEGAPNILLILTDDVGFGAASTFGGPVPTPNLDRLARRGLTYSNFHTTAMCSPTRAALLTGRNHHAVGFGAIAENNSPYPGYNTELPADARTVAEILHRSGYATSMFGKLHLTPGWHRSLTGPHSQWPTKLGFDYFFGFLSADSDQWRPTLLRGTTLVDNGDKPLTLLDKDMVSDAIRWLHQAKADYPDKPFFTYFSTGSAHAPHQAPEEFIARFHGRFDNGWDALRAETVARQKRSGILPSSAKVSPRPESLESWSSLSRADQRLYARYMEVFAAQLAYQDAQIGRLFDELVRIGEIDDTLIIFVEGDNGSSGEGGHEGSLNEIRHLFKDDARFTASERADLDRLGGESSYQIYPAGWAWALNAPFPLFKQNASHLGGTRNGMIVSWPKRIAEPGRTIGRFQHVIDIAPTMLEAAGVAMPREIDGVPQRAMQGVSLYDSFSANPSVRASRAQYFELLGNRALYQDGWWANTIPGRMPWERGGIHPEAYQWQLFNLASDPAQAADVSARYPERLEAMKEEWHRQALANNVYPLRAQPEPGDFRPQEKRDEFVFWGSGVHLPWTTQPNLQRGDFTIEVSFSVDSADQAEGVLMATGSLMGGWSLKLENGKPVFYHAATEAAADTFRLDSDISVGTGHHQLSVLFNADSDRHAAGGNVRMILNGALIAQQHIDRRAIRPMATNEMFDIGMDTGVSVIAGQSTWQRFQGAIHKVTIRPHH
jgi:arylsulfatase A-like enzyme